MSESSIACVHVSQHNTCQRWDFLVLSNVDIYRMSILFQLCTHQSPFYWRCIIYALVLMRMQTSSLSQAVHSNGLVLFRQWTACIDRACGLGSTASFEKMFTSAAYIGNHNVCARELPPESFRLQFLVAHQTMQILVYHIHMYILGKHLFFLL